MNAAKTTLAAIALFGAFAACGNGKATSSSTTGSSSSGSGGSKNTMVNACATPTVIPDKWAGTNTITRTFSFDDVHVAGASCFMIGTNPAVAFEWTADKTAATGFKFAVEAATGTDRLVVEVFKDRNCDDSSLIDCGMDRVGSLQPVLEKNIDAGTTYTIAIVSKVVPAPPGTFTLRLGD